METTGKAFLEQAALAVRQSLTDTPPAVLPPPEMMATIGSPSAEHYLSNMRLYVGDLIIEAGIRPNSRILDIGSGCGRIATGFTRYLSREGAYTGFDVWQEGVQWCREHITPLHPSFTFHHVTAENNYYYGDDTGTANAFDLSFVPHGDCDAILALSVFTHLRLGDAKQYLAMIADALSPTGFAYLTFFVIDDHARRFMAETGQHAALAPAGDGMWYAYERQWFFSGYEPDFLRAQFSAHGLEVCKSSLGSWAQKPDARLYQDWFLLRRS